MSDRCPGAADAGPEPQLATDPRHDRGPGPGPALERHGAGGRARGVPALHLGRLGRAASRADGAPCIRTARLRLRVPEVVSLTHYDRLPEHGRDVQPAERGQARPLHLPVLRRAAGGEAITIDHVLPRSQGGTSSWTNCVAACDGVQRPQGRPHPRAGRHAAPQAPGPARVEAVLRRHGGPRRKLGPVPDP